MFPPARIGAGDGDIISHGDGDAPTRTITKPLRLTEGHHGWLKKFIVTDPESISGGKNTDAQSRYKV